MRTFKALLTTLAVGAVSTVLAVSAFAAESDVKYEDGKLIASNYTTSEGQMTALVVEATKWDSISDASPLTAGDILYINQFAMADADTILTNMGIKGELVEGTTYYVLIGGENATEIQKLSITYSTSAGVTYKWCDVDNDGDCDADDTARLLRHTGFIESLTYENDVLLTICDVDKDGDVDADDTARLLRHTGFIESLPGIDY